MHGEAVGFGFSWQQGCGEGDGWHGRVLSFGMRVMTESSAEGAAETSPEQVIWGR
jgi:hypothetical protein